MAVFRAISVAWAARGGPEQPRQKGDDGRQDADLLPSPAKPPQPLKVDGWEQGNMKEDVHVQEVKRMARARARQVDVWLTPDQVERLAERFQRARQRGRARLRLRTVADQADTVELEVEEAPAPTRETEKRPRVEDLLREIAAEIPEDARRSLPPDLTDNLDHYLYGTPRR